MGDIDKIHQIVPALQPLQAPQRTSDRGQRHNPHKDSPRDEVELTNHLEDEPPTDADLAAPEQNEGLDLQA